MRKKIIIEFVVLAFFILFTSVTVIKNFGVFPNANEHSVYVVKKFKKLNDLDNLKFNKDRVICINQSLIPLIIDDVEYYKIDFSCRNQSLNEYLYRIGNNIFYAVIDSKKVTYRSPLFLLSKKRDDFSVFIDKGEIFKDYYIEFEKCDYLKSDTIYEFNFHAKNNVVEMKGNGNLTFQVIMDGPINFKKFWVSNKLGIVKIQTKEEGYLVTYTLK